MDGWGKIEVISKFTAALLIPLAIAQLGNQVATANKQRDSETKFVELATAILSKEPEKNQSIYSVNLRAWAVDIINKFSGVKMSPATASGLINSIYLPQALNTYNSDPKGTWGVVFGGDSTLNSAKVEIKRMKNNSKNLAGVIFRREGSFRSVRVETSRPEADSTLENARKIKPDAYIVNMETWCPASDFKTEYFECI